jgi:NAD(P)-dependent dehydrogenase (short-subunit alcohol dehydrogenase family)
MKDEGGREKGEREKREKVAGGIGRELTKVVYSLGGTVVALDRNVTGLELLREDLEGRRSNGKDIEDDRSRVLCLVTNHEDLSSVSSSADIIKTRFGTIDLLVCNAGLTYRDDCVPGEERMKSKHGYDLAFTVNYLSHFLLVEKLLPCLSSHPSGRIVHLTSSFHWKVDGSEITPLDNGMNGPMAYQSDPSLMSSKHIERSYANSKLAQIWHSRTTKKCVGSVCACPTWAGTGIAGEESRDFLLQNAFDVSGPGIASALNAMLRSDDELGDALNDGKSIVANSRVIEYIPFKDLWAMDWISRSGLRDIMAEVSALVLLIGQRFTFEQFIIQRSSPESYGCREGMESLRRWSLKAVEPFL